MFTEVHKVTFQFTDVKTQTLSILVIFKEFYLKYFDDYAEKNANLLRFQNIKSYKEQLKL